MRILRAGDHRRMAWKNGGGETTEIAVWPPGAGLAEFDWRVSMARVESDGPFSLFPGIDRTLCLLSGEGMDLDIAGHGRFALTTASPPLAFPADAQTSARLLGRSITDLNVMTRRDAFRHAVEPVAAAPRADLALNARWSLILAAGPCRIGTNGGTAADLGALDAVLTEDALSMTVWASGDTATLFVVTIAS